MAERAKNEEDPSIEEILDSIRRIISDDVVGEPEAEPEPEPVVEAKPEPVRAPEPVVVRQPEPEPEPDVVFLSEIEPEFEEPAVEEVLVLTDRVDEPLPEPQPQPVTQAAQIIEEQIGKQPLQVDLRDAHEPKPEPVMDLGADEDAVFTGKVEAEAYEAISSLARKVALGRGSLTLEDIVRQELKPLLRGWLNQNLSSVIDRLVREELERVSNRVLED